MTNENRRTLHSLAESYPTGAWDVLHGCDTSPDLPVCTSYASILVALDALSTAGFAATPLGTPAPGLDGDYDLTTCLRFRDTCGQGVVLVRRYRQS